MCGIGAAIAQNVTNPLSLTHRGVKRYVCNRAHMAPHRPSLLPPSTVHLPRSAPLRFETTSVCQRLNMALPLITLRGIVWELTHLDLTLCQGQDGFFVVLNLVARCLRVLRKNVWLIHGTAVLDERSFAGLVRRSPHPWHITAIASTRCGISEKDLMRLCFSGWIKVFGVRTP